VRKFFSETIVFFRKKNQINFILLCSIFCMATIIPILGGALSFVFSTSVSIYAAYQVGADQYWSTVALLSIIGGFSYYFYYKNKRDELDTYFARFCGIGCVSGMIAGPILLWVFELSLALVCLMFDNNDNTFIAKSSNLTNNHAISYL